MEDHSHSPSLIIGVDFGMTCTGVAFSQSPRWSDPKTFQQWTSIISELANKVPTRLGYLKTNSPANPSSLATWGLYCPSEAPNLDVQELFKLNMDPDYVDPYESAPSVDQARQWYVDYLRCVHNHVAQHFSSRVPEWRNTAVEWVFSVPTTWRNPKMVADIEAMIRIAGFGNDGPWHRASVTLNEAEAAAISVARQYLRYDDVLMVCDAGGGTSDVSVLKMTSQQGEATRLMPLLPVEGGWFGSALIDMAAMQLIIKRLECMGQNYIADPHGVAQKMMSGRFERFKCAFGGEGTDVPMLPLQIPGIPPGINYPEVGVFDSSIVITREELNDMFDQQVNGIIELMDRQLRKLMQKHPHLQASYIVLSGGLGASPYLRKRIIAHFENGMNYPNAQALRVLLAEQPQLAVAHGLVADRVQMVTQRVTAIRDRPARLSYGVVCDQLYKEEKHAGENVFTDARDGKRWARFQIEWIIKQGERVPPGGVAKTFRAKIQQIQIGKPWKAQIVMSAYPPDQLPRSMIHSGVTTLCIVESTLTGVKMEVKNKHWWEFKKKHKVAEFDLKVIPGSADLKFQLWSNENMISRDQENLAVVWDRNGPAPRQAELQNTNSSYTGGRYA